MTTTKSADGPASARQYCQAQIDHFAKKADHNKTEALSFFILIIAGTLSTSLFVTLGKADIYAKIVPSVLSLIAAFGTAWVQVRKPQQLWSLYRKAQRETERELAFWEFQIGEYAENEHADALLVERCADIKMAIHNQWSNLVPSAESIKLIGAQGAVHPDGAATSTATRTSRPARSASSKK